MDQKPRLIIVGVAALIALAVVSAVAIFIGRAVRENAPTAEGGLDSLSRLPVQVAPSTSPTPSLPTDQPPLFKVYQGLGFSLLYPYKWGLLSCTNSQNIEFDPENSNDFRGACDVAVKPVTILVADRLDCPGETVTIGGYQIKKFKTSGQNGDIDYRWCLSVGGKNLDITHRVSTSGSRATTKEDLSEQIERMISNIGLGEAS